MVTFTEVDADPFAPPPVKPPRFTEVSQDPWSENTAALQATALDMAKTAPASLVRGVAALGGFIGDASEGLAQGSNYLANKIADAIGVERYELPAREKTLGQYVPQTAEVRGAIEDNITGPLYQPQTRAGRYVNAVGELVPTAIAPGGPARALLNYAVLPGLASEGVREATGSELAGTAAAVATGGVAGLVNKPRTIDRAIRSNMNSAVDATAVSNAERLMQDAQARGVTLTWAEALEQVAPGSGLTNLQRVVESTKEGRDALAPVFAARPGQIDRAAGQVFDAVTPAAPNPSQIGPAIGRAAEAEAEHVRGAINQASEPFYTAAAPQMVPPAVMGQIRTAPGWREASEAVRNDPQLARYVQGLPDNSVGFLNEVKKYLDTAAENATQPVGTQGRNMQRSAGYGQDATAVRDVAVRTSAQHGDEYWTALEIQRRGREQYLDPLLQGPMGKLAKTDLTTQQAIGALFPTNPLPNSAQEITQTVGALARRHPYATRNLIRAHAESTFNEAMRNNIPGANEFGGAKFSKMIAGNAQQRQNLQAAIEASGPDGARVWDGFNRFLDIVEATGKRQQIGSKTAFNQQDLKDLSSGSAVGNAIKTGASPGKWVSTISDAWSRWQLGGNISGIADVLVDPRSRGLLTKIARAPSDGVAGQIMAARLIGLGIVSAAQQSVAPRRQAQ